MNFDQKNKNILNILQKKGRISNNDLSDEVGVPTTTVFERIKKMEKEDIIKGYKAIVDPNKVGLGLLSFVFIRTDIVNYDENLVKEIEKIPFVLELHEVAGDYSYVAKVCARDTAHLSIILKHYFGRISGVSNTNSHIVLTSSLDNGNYPIMED